MTSSIVTLSGKTISSCNNDYCKLEVMLDETIYYKWLLINKNRNQ